MKRLYGLLALLFGLHGVTYGMHIMEGFLPISWSLFWWALMLPVLIWGIRNIRKLVENQPDYKMLLALAGAFAFVLSSLKLPSVTGSCSHPTGMGLGTILFGSPVMSVIGSIVLIFQALLLAHGGLTTLGANTFSMAIAGPVAITLIYKTMSGMRINHRLTIFIAVTAGGLVTYLVTACQLALAHPEPASGFLGAFWKFAGIFAVTQIPLAISEGLLTVFMLNILNHYTNFQMTKTNDAVKHAHKHDQEPTSHLKNPLTTTNTSTSQKKRSD